jgi:hypothetical protein
VGALQSHIHTHTHFDTEGAGNVNFREVIGEAPTISPVKHQINTDEEGQHTYRDISCATSKGLTFLLNMLQSEILGSDICEY